jgi:hypothetical protein
MSAHDMYYRAHLGLCLFFKIFYQSHIRLTKPTTQEKFFIFPYSVIVLPLQLTESNKNCFVFGINGIYTSKV